MICVTIDLVWFRGGVILRLGKKARYPESSGKTSEVIMASFGSDMGQIGEGWSLASFTCKASPVKPHPGGGAISGSLNDAD